MSADETANVEPAKLLRRLFRGMERRRGIDGAARVELDRHLISTLDDYAVPLRETIRGPITEPPPRAVGVSMATAVYSQPHVTVIFGDITPIGTEDFELPPLVESEVPLVVGGDDLQTALGLAKWELDDIREDVDRRVGVVLKQSRAIRWMWGHFGLPEASCEPLFRVLFPSVPGRVGAITMIRRGAQLYAAVAQEAAPPIEALYLPWAPVTDRGFHPLRTFQGRYVNANLRRALCRGIGADDDELVALFDRMVTVVPRQGTKEWLGHDTWRSRGFAFLTDLAGPYSDGAWMVSPLAPDDLAWPNFLACGDGRITLDDPREAFDDLAKPRVDEMIRQLYAAMFARLQIDPLDGPTWSANDVPLFDIERHIRAVLKPLLDWADSPTTVAHVTAKAKVSEGEAAVALARLSGEWRDQLEQVWVGIPKEGGPPNTQGLVTDHLVRTWDSLRRILRTPADPRAPHRDIALLFAAFYLGRAPLDRLWSDANESTTWPSHQPLPDHLGRYFWSTWLGLLDRLDTDPAA